MKTCLNALVWSLIIVVGIAGGDRCEAASTCNSISGTCWYVDNQAPGTNDGSDWTNAWQNLSVFEREENGGIAWSSIQPGDTIYISGGATEKTYTERLLIPNRHGSPGLPITFRVGEDSGHNGDVIITTDDDGIVIVDSSYITINGNVNGTQKIKVKNCSDIGINMFNPADIGYHHIILTYLDVFDNGDASGEYGIRIADIEPIEENEVDEKYPMLEISYSKIHNNWTAQIMAFELIAFDFGAVTVHDNEIYDIIRGDGFESAMGGTDFYNNELHTRAGPGGHTDGIQFYGEYYRIYNNIFHNFDGENMSSTSYLQVKPGSDTPLERSAKEIYIYNNLLYDNQMFPGDTSLRGIMFVPNNETVASIENVLIAGNTVVGMPTTGLSVSFTERLSLDQIHNVSIVNNIFHNCYTNGGGAAVGLSWIKSEDMVGSAGSGAKVIFDHNIVSEGINGSNYVNFNDSFIHQEDLVSMGININGEDIDPSLDSNFKPDSQDDPTVDAGMRLSDYFAYDLDGTSRPQGLAWDIGAYEYPINNYMLWTQ